MTCVSRKIMAAMVCIMGLAVPHRAEAVIRRLYTLKEVVDASNGIAVGVIEEVNIEKKTAVARFDRWIKGTNLFDRLKMNLAVGQSWYPDALIKTLKVGEPAIYFFGTSGSDRATVAHSCNVWFQFFGSMKIDPDQWWRMTHIEPYMNRTFPGSTRELIAVTAAALEGKGEYPAPRPETPGLTPEMFGLGQGGQPQQQTQGPFKIPEQESVDGFEASGGWAADDPENKADFTVNDVAGRGKVITINCRPGGKGRLSMSSPIKEDLSVASRLLFEARNNGSEPVEIAWAFLTFPDKTRHESRPVKLAPGAWIYDCEIGLSTAAFKNEKTDGLYNAALGKEDTAEGLTILISGVKAEGTVQIDRVRLDAGSTFVRSIRLPHRGGEARSVSWADYDLDGDLDALVCSTEMNLLYRNDRGDFVDVTQESGLKGGSRCASWADYDLDGDPDLFYSTPVLYNNDKGKFSETKDVLPLLSCGYAPEGAGWADVNGDGRADIIFTNGGNGIFIFLNQGPGAAFKEASSEFGLGPGKPGAVNGDFLSIADFDSDGYVDFLYNVNNGLLMRNNDGGGFSLMDKCGIAYETQGGFKTGTAFGDSDGDGNVDLFCPQPGKPRFFRNNNDMTFKDILADTGDLSSIRDRSRTAAWGDVNCDGLNDLVVGFENELARLYVNGGSNKFADKTADSGLTTIACTRGATGMAFADMDNDGDPDLLVTGEKDSSGILINGTSRLSSRKLPVRVRLAKSEPPGAIVRLYNVKGVLCGTSQTALAGNFSSQSPAEAVFHVPSGTYTVSVLHTIGKTDKQEVKVEGKEIVWDVPMPAL